MAETARMNPVERCVRTSDASHLTYRFVAEMVPGGSSVANIEN